MARKNKNLTFQSKPSGNSFMKKINDNKIANEEQQILLDERVKAKIEELNQKIADTDKLKQELESQYQIKNADIETQKEEIKQKLEEIRANEQEIRQREYQQLLVSWAKERDKKMAEINSELESQRITISEELKKAHEVRISAENEKLERVYSADKDIEARYAQLNAEYQNKLAKLDTALTDYQQKKAEYDIELEELEGDRIYIQELKKRYETCSEVEVKRLQLKIKQLEDINLASQKQIAEQSKKIANLEVRALNISGQSAFERIDELEKQLENATAQLDEYSNLPSPSRIAELQQCEEMLKMQRIELDETKAQLVTAQTQLSAYALDKRELENIRTTASVLESLNDQLQKKLQYITEQYKSNHESKFKGLLEIDNEKYVPSKRELFTGSLSELVDYIRNYGANPKRKTPLYYSKETIRVFIASLAASEPSSRLIILQGLSGTGKSSLPQLFRDALDIRWHSISVQPSWRDNRELLGYDNDFTNRFKETEFTKAIYKASKGDYKDDIVFIVLDEINLARIEYYFADFLSELEHRNANWTIPLISSYFEPNDEQKPLWLNYDNGTANILITKNIWFIGTANNDDSTSLITDKVYDRAQILDMDERESDFNGQDVTPKVLDFFTLIKLFETARKNKKNKMSDSDWLKLNQIDEYNLRPMDITFGNRMKKQLEDFIPIYIACGGTKKEGIDYFLAHKILRKLDEKYDAYIADCLEELIDALNSHYGEGAFKKSLKKIDCIKKRNFNLSAGDE